MGDKEMFALSRCLENNWQEKNEREKEKTHLETTPQRHTEYREHREVTNAESRMAGQKCAEGREETLQLLQGTLAGWAKKQSTESADGL